MGSVAIDVSDTGVGIPRVNLERIFEPFFTTRADSGGTGLGLGLCRMLISEMGGRIEVRSALGQGTTFTVVLNRADAKSSVKKRLKKNKSGNLVVRPPRQGTCLPSALELGGAIMPRHAPVLIGVAVRP